jgi:hypothetical protein
VVGHSFSSSGASGTPVVRTDGFDSTVGFVLVQFIVDGHLTLSTFVSSYCTDGHGDTVGFVRSFMDGHNGTVHILSSASYSCGGYISTSTLVDRTDGHIDSVGFVVCCRGPVS